MAGLSEVLTRIASAPGALSIGGAPEGYDALLFCDAARARGGLSVFVARDDARAAAFASACAFFAPDIDLLRLPAWDCLPYDRVSPAVDLAAMRAGTLWALVQEDQPATRLVVTTINALTQRVPPRAELGKAGFAVRPGARIGMEALTAHLQINGYARASTVMEPGDYAVRGGVVDVFAPGQSEPVRLDFFGDTLESMRSFDPQTQRSLKTLGQGALAPVSEILLTPQSISRFRSGFVRNFGPAQNDALYDAVSAGARPQGIEHWLPLFYEQTETVFDYFGQGVLFALDHLSSESLGERVKMVEDYYAARKENAAQAHASALSAPAYRALDPDAFYLNEDAFNGAILPLDLRQFSPFALPPGDAHVDAKGKSGRIFAAERSAANTNVYDAVRGHINALRAAGKKVLIAGWSTGSAERTAGVLEDHGVTGIRAIEAFGDFRALPAKVIGRAVLPLDHGFETEDFAVIAEQDVLGDRLAHARRKKRAANFIAEVASLHPEDLVVHVDHGIGRFIGLTTLDVGEAPHDCLELHYAGGDKLFLPVENIELLSRYGSESANANLDKLGGAAWQARKAKAKNRLRDMAGELIEIAAAREMRTADVITPPAGEWDEFCARFPFVETDDQLSSIADVLDDLGKGRPMDRLICGDVGFGKTEIALRAAFVVAMTGRQVAVVAPTTLLARQHYRTFKDRFAGWPVKIGRLSRLVPTKEAKATREGLASGQTDIVIGTHALLGKQIKFRDLSLMIIDEEQHFGVRHKEQLKALRADVHVLTLTATPIPRTLQMALSGIRELSLIATPPVDRLAVRTYVAPFDEVTVREALLRERFRGGQSFFVVPRILDLDEIEQFLRNSVPEVSYIVAHGQMNPSDLEDIMTAFYEGRYDVLLSTTIIESGLDIPTANTLIVHRADRFGLSQLYQLRGRVGRSKVRGYAYLTIPAKFKITKTAEARLKVLSSLDTLGAGFMLASHDLDLRGGGNLLGEEQSGQIRDVGVELYQAMLEEAVAEMKTGDAQSDSEWTPQINTGVSVLIPDHYVPDLDVRLQLYRRLAGTESAEEREAFAAELIDRFGPLPDEAKHLLSVMQIKALCKKAGIEKADAGPKGVVLTFRGAAFANPLGLVDLMGRNPNSYKLRPDQKLVMRGNWPEPVQRLRGVEMAVREIADLVD
ncbi:MAG: transcription-repair coupling factor [Robiginitomaculum sp.]|nr:MAG: transcription-repair coupling factor [Robiginitomaculum sp.]